MQHQAGRPLTARSSPPGADTAGLPPAGASVRVFPRLERSGLGRAKSWEAGVLLRPVAFGAAPAGQVSGQGLLQGADTRSAGWFQPAPACSSAASSLPRAVLRERRRGGARLWPAHAPGRNPWMRPMSHPLLWVEDVVWLRHHH